MNKDAEQYLLEEHRNADGTSRKVMKNAAGLVIGEEFYDKNGRTIESKSYDAAGNIVRRAAYEQDGQRKPAKITAYDQKGCLIFVHERGKPPIFYGKHQAGAPVFMRGGENK